MLTSLSKKEVIFQKYLERLKRELRFAYLHFMIYKQLDKAREEYKNELMKAPEFFTFSEHSHAVEAVLRINRICENHPNSLNMFSLLDYIKANLSIFSEKSYKRRRAGQGHLIINDIANRPLIDIKFIDQQRKLYLIFQKTNIKKLRNRVLAHIDLGDVINDVYQYEKYVVEPDALEIIMNEIDDTLNTFEFAFTGMQHEKGFSHLTIDIKNMLDCIRRGSKYNERLKLPQG